MPFAVLLVVFVSLIEVASAEQTRPGRIDTSERASFCRCCDLTPSFDSVPAGQGAIISRNIDEAQDSNLRRPTNLDELEFLSPRSLRGGKTHLYPKKDQLRDGHEDLAHHYSESTLKQRQRVGQRDKIIIALRCLSAIGTVSSMCFYSYPLVAWLL
jgi:hypothetical protein